MDPATGDESIGVDSMSVPPHSRSNESQRHTAQPNRSKRSWSEAEDALLIQILLELHATGKYKADRGFKPDPFTAAEKEMERRMPGGGIRADPHIYSRVKTLKSHYNIVADMVFNNTSGFGWDSEQKCVTAEDVVWAAYIQTHKSAAQFRGKSFKYFDELAVLFGSDRAKGTGATSHAPAANTEMPYVNIASEEAGDNAASQSGAESGAPPSVDSGAYSGGRKRKITRDDGFYATIRDSNAEMISLLRVCNKDLCDAINNVHISTKRVILGDALLEMQTLTPDT